MLEFIKTHKLESAIIFIAILILIFIVIFAKIFFFSDSGDPYGDRLDGIEEHRINNDKLAKIETDLKKEDSVTNVDAFITGRVVNIMIDLKNDIDYEDSKKYGEEAVANFNKKELSFYDVQIYLISDNSDIYPKIGYKGKKSQEIVWMK